MDVNLLSKLLWAGNLLSFIVGTKDKQIPAQKTGEATQGPGGFG